MQPGAEGGLGVWAYRRNAETVGEAARFAPFSGGSKVGRFAYIALLFNNLQLSLHKNLRRKTTFLRIVVHAGRIALQPVFSLLKIPFSPEPLYSLEISRGPWFVRFPG
jgi:hypothetical protein